MLKQTALIFAALTTAAAAQEAQVSGQVGTGAPEDVFLEVTTGPNGEPVLSAGEFRLAWGGYYRFNFVCPDAQDDSTGFHLESPDLMKNIHLRVVSVGDIEIYMQGLGFNAIECDEAGAARFSFHPMRAGTYDMLIRDHSDPPQAGTVRIVVE